MARLICSSDTKSILTAYLSTHIRSPASLIERNFYWNRHDSSHYAAIKSTDEGDWVIVGINKSNLKVKKIG